MGNEESLITADKALMGGDTNEIIKANYEKEQPTVSARELHKRLDVKYRFSRWVESNFSEFTKDEDYFGADIDVHSNQYGGTQTLDDYDLTIDMAKHLCLMSKTVKGKKCRQDLIDLEKAWNSPEQIMARALKIANDTIDKIKSQNAVLIADNQRMKPKEEFFDAVTDSKDAIEIGKVAKVLNFPGVGRNKLFEILRDKGILMKNNIPYQKYIDNGCFRTIEQKYSTPDGEIRISIKTLVYQKGVDFIRKTLEAA